MFLSVAPKRRIPGQGTGSESATSPTVDRRSPRQHKSSHPPRQQSPAEIRRSGGSTTSQRNDLQDSKDRRVGPVTPDKRRRSSGDEFASPVSPATTSSPERKDVTQSATISQGPKDGASF